MATQAVDILLVTSTMKNTAASLSSSRHLNTLKRGLRKTTKEHPRKTTSRKSRKRSLRSHIIKSIQKTPNPPRRGYRRLRLAMEL